jgi:hypothetical protein
MRIFKTKWLARLNAPAQKISIAIEDGVLQEVDLDEQKDT